MYGWSITISFEIALEDAAALDGPGVADVWMLALVVLGFAAEAVVLAGNVESEANPAQTVKKRTKAGGLTRRGNRLRLVRQRRLLDRRRRAEGA